MRAVAVAGLTGIFASPLAAIASEKAATATRELLTFGGLLALGVGALFIIALVYLCYYGIFVHLATRIVGLKRPFSTAVWAVVVSILFQIAGFFLFSLVVPVGTGVPFVISLLFTALAIMIVYEAGLLQALASAILSVLLTVIGTLATAAILAVLLSWHLPQTHRHPQQTEQPGQSLRI